MADPEMALMSHLLRRAGFGATRDELEAYAAKDYEATVEELLHPEKVSPALENEDVTRRYHIDEINLYNIITSQAHWLRRMINTRRPLEEKIALFWHGIFATGFTKSFQPKAVLRQIDTFRRYGLGSFHTLLVELSKDPAMIFWLDNKDNHGDAVNENYGRELLELFSMGVGNYTEGDVRQASHAFTGWTMLNAPYLSARAERQSVWPFGSLEPIFQYKDDDHDHGRKSFLGHEGVFNGEDIIDIVCRQPATARFIVRHLYTFFVADEVQVPAWQTVGARDPEAIGVLMEAFIKSGYDMRSVLQVLFNSDFFKEAAYARVKSPAELVAGTARLVGGYDFPSADDISLAGSASSTGQALLNPPSVEGWHTGKEWLNTASLVNRVNFAVQQFSDVDRLGVRSMVGRIRDQGAHRSPERLVDACLDLLGPMTVPDSTRRELLGHAASLGEVRFGSEEDRSAAQKIASILQLIVSTRQYQMA